jgi:hypothetical protein
VPTFMENPAAPDVVLEFIECKCKSNCSTRRCKCRHEGLVCTDACQCESDQCTNRISHDESSDDSEEEKRIVLTNF